MTRGLLSLLVRLGLIAARTGYAAACDPVSPRPLRFEPLRPLRIPEPAPLPPSAFRLPPFRR